MTRGKQGAVRGRQGNMLSGISQECGGAGSTVNPPPSPHTPRTPPHLRLEDGCRLHKRGVRGVARAENHRRGEPAGRGGEGEEAVVGLVEGGRGGGVSNFWKTKEGASEKSERSASFFFFFLGCFF